MSISADDAPRPEHEPFECLLCEGCYVMYDGDKVCVECGYVTGSTERHYNYGSSEENEWESWWSHREEYDGWFGPDRVKMVGGFIGSWDFVEDDYLSN